MDLLQDRLRTFIYSKKQDQLAGRDGEERFGEVFNSKARVVIVLCRPEWGGTPFTRIEETAIRNRAFDEGYDFTLFVPTTNPPTVPKWLPKTRLYYGLERFGVKGLGAVVERLVEEKGGSPRTESVVDRAARFERASNFRRERDEFRRSSGGVKLFEAAVASLFQLLSEQFAALKGVTPSLRSLEILVEHGLFIVAGRSPVLIVGKRGRYSNSLDECEANVSYYDSFPHTSGRYGSDEAVVLKENRFSFDLVSPTIAAFVLEGDHFSPETLKDRIIRDYFDVADKQPQKNR